MAFSLESMDIYSKKKSYVFSFLSTLVIFNVCWMWYIEIFSLLQYGTATNTPCLLLRQIFKLFLLGKCKQTLCQTQALGRMGWEDLTFIESM